MAQERKKLFDEWPDKYDTWFETPIGLLVKKYETALLMNMLRPGQEDSILDVGCGTGIFTADVLSRGCKIIGLDISLPMLQRAAIKTSGQSFAGIVGDMGLLPFADNTFDKVCSMTALEFLADGYRAVEEFNRVARQGATIVVTTLNSLSPWAEKRKKKGDQGHSLFKSMTFRSPTELLALAPPGSQMKTAIHFQKDDNPADVPHIEERGMKEEQDTGAFVAVSWIKNETKAA